jgi:hypothetical protein
MKKAIMALMSIVFLLGSVWGVNARNHRSKSRPSTDTTLWV